ncbi:MAG: papain-like cysteine protease family protein [Candidatus Solibacter sp.]
MEVEKQLETQWCWAAVAVSIHNFLNPGGTTWTQADVATPVLHAEHRIGPSVDCSVTPGTCNIPAALDQALHKTGNLRREGFLPNQLLPFDNIKEWVDLHLPVGVRILWWGGGGHFVVIAGYRVLDSIREQLLVLDPRGYATFVDYEDLVADYGEGGIWQDTYLVKRSTVAPGGI